MCNPNYIYQYISSPELSKMIFVEKHIEENLPIFGSYFLIPQSLKQHFLTQLNQKNPTSNHLSLVIFILFHTPNLKAESIKSL